uniref:protein IQ-DOMAIN 32-like n=1 Tax=Erigeron canadensis TaxID=72917 RepID=UPI001CB90AC5|nr:protein IQ-DOMAIN 32-like [Erigeron canadensis]
MGRSTNSCFKIISCGGSNDSVDLDAPSSEGKGPDKRGWSFRKRSARHRVLSNTVVTEPTTIQNKEKSEPVTYSSEPQLNSAISEKTPDNIWTEEIPSLVMKSTTVSTMVNDSPIKDEIKCLPVPDESESESESAILVIQAAVRQFLAKSQLEKHKNAVKLQAAVRGHLVRIHAVGTLRCVQAIVKMQALVRARQEKGVEKVGINSRPTYISIEKLLSNRLARQLLDSTPKTKPINIKCDPSKSGSAWSWLERWMAVSSPETLESHTQEHDQREVIKTENEVEIASASCVVEAALPSVEKQKSIDMEENFHLKNHEEEQPIPESLEKPGPGLDESMGLVPEARIEVSAIPENAVSVTEPKPILDNSESETEVKPVPEHHVSETEPKPIIENQELETKPKPVIEDQVLEIEPKPTIKNQVLETEPKRPGKRLATEQADSDGRKSVFGLRKASNPAFIAAQSRFEELTSKTSQLKSPNSSNQDNEADSSVDICSSEPSKPAASFSQNDEAGSPTDVGSSDHLKSVSSSNQDNDVNLVANAEPDEYLVPHSSKAFQNGGSECGTELSITSTLDSPDQSPQVENKKFEEEAKGLDEAVGYMNSKGNQNIDIVMPEKHDSVEDFKTEKLKLGSNVEQKIDDCASDADIELEPVSGHHVYKSNSHMEHEHEPKQHEDEPKNQEMVSQMSVEGSPRSHITFPESQGTPSSQVSTNTKKSRSDKKVSSQKRKSWSSSKKSSVDSGLRTSLEKLPKDPKSGKRRNSFGSPKPDHSDQEGRDSSNSSLPSYMQATESAKLKAIANISPRSSPDLQDKDLKKRHSLPGAVNGRHDSPRIQRSMSQALQTAKGSGNQVTERKWQR